MKSLSIFKYQLCMTMYMPNVNMNLFRSRHNFEEPLSTNSEMMMPTKARFVEALKDLSKTEQQKIDDAVKELKNTDKKAEMNKTHERYGNYYNIHLYNYLQKHHPGIFGVDAKPATQAAKKEKRKKLTNEKFIEKMETLCSKLDDYKLTGPTYKRIEALIKTCKKKQKTLTNKDLTKDQKESSEKFLKDARNEFFNQKTGLATKAKKQIRQYRSADDSPNPYNHPHPRKQREEYAKWLAEKQDESVAGVSTPSKQDTRRVAFEAGGTGSKQ